MENVVEKIGGKKKIGCINKAMIISLLLQALVVLFSFAPLIIFDHEQPNLGEKDSSSQEEIINEISNEDEKLIMSEIMNLEDKVANLRKTMATQQSYKSSVQLIENSVFSSDNPDLWTEYMCELSGNSSSIESFSFSIGFFSFVMLGEALYCVIYFVYKFRKALKGSEIVCSYVPSLVLSISSIYTTLTFNSWFNTVNVVPSCFTIMIYVITVLQIVLKQTNSKEH